MRDKEREGRRWKWEKGEAEGQTERGEEEVEVGARGESEKVNQFMISMHILVWPQQLLCQALTHIHAHACTHRHTQQS